MRTVIALVVFALAAPIAVNAGQKVLSVKWSDLPAQIAGKHVRVVLADGVHLEGRATSVGAESLVVDVKKSSDSARIDQTASLR